MSFISPGQVVWFEIGTGTTDPDAVTGFYGPLLGWNFEIDPDSSVDGRTYTRILAPGAPWPMGAIQQGDTGDEAVNLSILSADVHADVERLTGLGATVVVPATQVADVTVFARLADPRGNLFSLFSRSASRRFEERIAGTDAYMRQTARTPEPGAMGRFEIGTADVRETTDFYRAAFGWRFERDGTAGGTPYFNVFGPGARWPSGGLWDHGRDDAGGADHVMPCFLVTDVAATTHAARRLGGRAELGPCSRPDGTVHARLTDPRGNRFGLFSPPARPAAG
ncbi:VOC family protein [Streptomyces caatingaensis]|uniref:Hydroxylase n=1 Tax=Streptomyces caatingaensis TaxID=1678637 RepID=A0A0K9XMV6_9ACTN|nr:VOC family protein [Streptomyces caatingaensis]KNB54027.1 hydroxylase [Streptomyces caatingaensis]